MQFGLQVTPTVQLEDGAIGGGRPVERDLLADVGGSYGELLLGVAGDDEGRVRHWKSARCDPTRSQRARDGRHRHLPEVALGSKAVDQDAVGDLSGHPRHVLTHRGQEHFGHAMLVRARIEERRHQRVGVEITPKVELGAVLPAVPDRPHGGDELPHSRRRVRPRHRVPLLDVRLDLRAQPEQKTASGVGVQVACDGGHDHRVAAKSHRDTGSQLQPSGVLDGDGQGEERVVPGFCGPDRVVPVLLGLLGLAGYRAQVVADSSVDTHAGEHTGGTPAGPCRRVAVSARRGGSVPARRPVRRPREGRRTSSPRGPAPGPAGLPAGGRGWRAPRSRR